MIVTILFLGLAHFLAYKKAGKSTAEASQTVLWIATILTMGLLAYSIRNEGF